MTPPVSTPIPPAVIRYHEISTKVEKTPAGKGEYESSLKRCNNADSIFRFYPGMI